MIEDKQWEQFASCFPSEMRRIEKTVKNLVKVCKKCFDSVCTIPEEDIRHVLNEIEESVRGSMINAHINRDYFISTHGGPKSIRLSQVLVIELAEMYHKLEKNGS